MIRKLLCTDCAKSYVADGWHYRHTKINQCRQPDDACIKVIAGPETTIIPVANVMCDHCNADITGGPGVATTMWRDEGEPGRWESEYEKE